MWTLFNLYPEGFPWGWIKNRMVMSNRHILVLWLTKFRLFTLIWYTIPSVVLKQTQSYRLLYAFF